MKLVILALLSICACDSVGTDNVVPATLQPPELRAPSNGAAGIDNALYLEWAEMAGADAYEIQVSANNEFPPGDTEQKYAEVPETIVRNLSIGITYFWRVRAMADVDSSDWSRTWWFTPTSVAEPPPGTQLSYPDDGALDQPTIISFEWHPVVGASRYQIQVSLEDTFLRNSVNLIDLIGTQRDVVGLVPSYTYFWRVRASNPAGNGIWSATRHVIIAEAG